MFNKKKTSDIETQQPSSIPKPKTTSPSTPLSTTAASVKTAQAYKSHSPFPLKKDQQPATPIRKPSRLHVGKDIHLKGEITACDRLIVEGKVEASMNSSEVEISESGIFIGEVVIDTADISGKFEGTLTARTRLIVRKTGCVSGKIQYGDIEIEPGGEISGTLAKIDEQQPETAFTLNPLSQNMEKPTSTAKTLY
ncbi:MAG: polymer-forming cytoskeletal protein [Sneathiella sp.]|nr:polymer-forming cytoskeletal protein [Sneathiella sp.]